MNSTRAALLGSQVPRVGLVPKFGFSHGDDAAFLSSSYGLTPDEWQHAVQSSWLGERPDGKWAAGRCGLSVPRQNGKNGALETNELYKMVVLGRRILHTAHEVKTARKAFVRLASFFENERVWPELAALVREIRKTNGQEAIVLTNGGSCEFVARSRGSGRGYTVDDLVCDEAQELTDEQLEALLPTISSAPSGNPQMILTGTPPGPGSPGEVFTRMRNAGVAGKDRRLSWHEWSVDGEVDVTDRKLWAATNPSLGRRLSAAVIEDELAQMSEDGFARERLGRWASDSHNTVVPRESWDALRVSSAPDGMLAYGLDMSPDSSSVAISVGVRPESGPAYVECVQHRKTAEGTSWAVDWLADRRAGCAAVVVDYYSPAMALVPALKERKVKVTVTNAAEMARACGMFTDAIRNEAVTHFDQAAVNDALTGAKKRPIGDAGGWGWNRKNPTVDITPLVTVTLALYGVLTARRKRSSESSTGRRATVL
jgi:hypothetical protein